jgi:ABC-type Na+ efflux pump permease subunit
MHLLAQTLTIARWEVKRSLTMMRRDVLPLSIVLFILLVAVTGFAAQNGMHLQDKLYTIGVDDPVLADVFAGDTRFTVETLPTGTSLTGTGGYDLIVTRGQATSAPTQRGRAALLTLSRDYSRYVNAVYTNQPDLFAAYPLWIDLQNVRSELDFVATQSGQQVAAPPPAGQPVPEGTVVQVATPPAAIDIAPDQLRQQVASSSDQNDQVARYSNILTSKGVQQQEANVKIPSQISPPLPFDSIILIFVFIFPLYFTSQFFMMSIMNERVERRGEPLLSTPIHPVAIILGKALPYLLLMFLAATVLLLVLHASLVILAALFPVILFFLASAMIIGMIARSYKELSFISIFFSTIATSYLFFPSIFANVHVVSLISPLTLIVLSMQGDGFTLADYGYSTILFYLTSLVLFYIGIVNFGEEQLFSQHRLVPRVREFIGTALSKKRPYLSLFLLNLLLIPFVFMAQMMTLVLFFNLPMPYSLVLLIIAAAFIEELVKSIGLVAFRTVLPDLFTWRRLIPAAAVTAVGFLVGEKLLLLVTLTQITESIFGSVLFTSLQVLWMPLLLHFTCVLIVGVSLKVGGKRGYIPGLVLATAVHTLYNLVLIMGWSL